MERAKYPIVRVIKLISNSPIGDARSVWRLTNIRKGTAISFIFCPNLASFLIAYPDLFDASKRLMKKGYII